MPKSSFNTVRSPGRASRSEEVRPGPLFLAQRVEHRRYFFLEATPSSPAELAVSCGGWERCAPNYSVCRETFDFFGLEYVAEGNGTYTFEGHQTELKPGIVFAYTPGTSHAISSSVRRPLVKYFLDFHGSRAPEIFRSLPLSEGGTTWLRQPQVARELFDQILEAGTELREISQRLCTSIFEVLLLRIEHNAIRPEESACQALETYTEAMHHLNAHFRTMRSSSEVSEKLKITQAYLARLFQRYGNSSPHRVLTGMKMTEAATLLVGEGASVAEAAIAVGYPDPYHFSRAFKSFYGVAPSRFRIYRRP